MNWRQYKQFVVNLVRRFRVAKKQELKQTSWSHRKEAIKELVIRYRDVFQFWWGRRHEIKMPDLKEDEAHFLPAALSIQAAPVSPAGRLVARILIAILVVLFFWSVLGKMDIIANGQGKIIAGGYSKTIASVEVAKVIGLYVEQGQSVKAGDLLIELDSRAAQSEETKAEGDRQLALLQMERSKALLSALTDDRVLSYTGKIKEPAITPVEGVTQEQYAHAALHLHDQWQDYIAKRVRISSQIKRFGDALPLATKRALDYAELAKLRDVSEHAYLEKEQARMDLLGQLDEAKAQLASLTAETRKTAQDELYQATRIWSGAVQDVNKAFAHKEQLRITAPVDGVVQQLSVHTIGGVVPAAQTLMVIVPDRRTVELEAYVANKDIGFLHEGQRAQVKIDAYEYSKYGTIPAVVTHISRDAVDFSSGGAGQATNSAGKESAGVSGLMYAVKVSLQKSDILVDGKKLPLSPGMSGSVEIKTGERRIIEYFLSPLITHGHESLQER